jgi:hypothetical protein
MPSINIIAKDATVEIDSVLLQKFSTVAAKQKDATEFKVDVNSRYIKLLLEYMEHHQKKEVPAPTGQVQVSWEVEKVFDDKWDGKWFQKIVDAEADPFLTEFATAINHFDIGGLFRKLVIVLAIGMVGRAGSIKGDKLAEEFNRLALKNRV